MKLTLQEVEYVALLGRLALNDEDKIKYMNQLEDILKYMEVLSEVSTDDVEPMAGPITLYTPLRPDLVAPSLPLEEALANGPSISGEYFRVPRILE
ncbi:MAG: aspartyl-tRNA(Asn)/glutamyl-tRNA(Gln) amidotransferase subunit [Thermodesulfobacteriota bacterium]|nr:aspartyl-tRNA(Asn)/glutamyl-tRNA(Gln) amidotransferase subunit [Thermodesulfobacteriota bacterium]